MGKIIKKLLKIVVFADFFSKLRFLLCFRLWRSDPVVAIFLNLATQNITIV